MLFRSALRDTYLSKGSFGWSGASGTHFWVDPARGIGAILLMQTLPFYDEKSMQVYAGVEDAVIVGIAKSIEREAGREHFFKKGQPPFRLDAKSPVLYYLQRLRDEAHRFAIQGHRARRGKTRNTSTLESIPGVGAKRRQSLLARFGGLKGLMSASVDDIARVDGISRELAVRIYEQLH